MPAPFFPWMFMDYENRLQEYLTEVIETGFSYIEDEPIRVYHATREEFFEGFSDDKIGRGADPNSALGVYFCQDADEALGYVRNRTGEFVENAQLVVADVRPGKVFVFVSLDHFFGLTDGREDEWHNRTVFEALRERLIEEEYTGIAVDNLDILAVFSPTQIDVVSMAPAGMLVDLF